MKKCSIRNVCVLAFLFLMIFATVRPLRLALTCLCAAAAHEGGHLLAARLLGLHVCGLRFTTSGACIRIREHLSYKKEFLFAFSGPAVNLLCALVFPAFPQFRFFSLVFACLNLLPVGSFDGGRMLYCLAAQAGSFALAERVLFIGTLLSVTLLWLLSVCCLIRFGFSLSLFVFAASIFVKVLLSDK